MCPNKRSSKQEPHFSPSPRLHVVFLVKYLTKRVSRCAPTPLFYSILLFLLSFLSDNSCQSYLFTNKEIDDI